MNQTLFALDLEGVQIAIHETPDGFLLWWGDYVANEWREAFATLSEAFAMLALIMGDTEGNRAPALAVINKHNNY